MNLISASHLLEYGEIYREGEDELPLLLDPDIRSELGGISGMILDYIVNVNGGVLEAPPLTGNWKITGREGSV